MVIVKEMINVIRHNSGENPGENPEKNLGEKQNNLKDLWNVLGWNTPEKQASEGEVEVFVITDQYIVDDSEWDERRRQEEEEQIIDNQNNTLASVLLLEQESLPESDYIQSEDYPDNQDGFVDYLWSDFPTDFGDGFGDGFWDVDPFGMGI